jgi:glycosyltransferase involved in cell wall biosynthesis
MKISVVTVAYNAAATIGATIESFLAQDHPDKELIVVDGASRDATLDVLAGFPRAQITVLSEPDRGLYDAMNKGLARFAGGAVGFLNADDRFHDSGALSAIAEGLSRADIVFGDLDYVAPDGRIVRRWRGTPFAKGSFRRGWMPAHPTFYVRRAVAERVGAFDLGYRVAADYDWMLRACELNDFSSAFLARTLIDMAPGGASTESPRAYLRHNIEALRARRRRLGTAAIDLAFFAKPLRKLAQFGGGGHTP